jgi:hypothetical protein
MINALRDWLTGSQQPTACTGMMHWNAGNGTCYCGTIRMGVASSDGPLGEFSFPLSVIATDDQPAQEHALELGAKRRK